METNQRLYSLDVFRGMTLCTMPLDKSVHHTLAHLLAAQTHATPKQVKEPIIKPLLKVMYNLS